MKQSLHFLFFLFLSIFFISCNGRPNIIDYNIVAGYVIGKETCNTNDADDYWLVDLTYYANTPQYGDTLSLNGMFYTNVVKVKELDPTLKVIRKGVSFHFKTVTPNKIETSGCNVINPIIYKLKQLFIIEQGEIR